MRSTAYLAFLLLSIWSFSCRSVYPAQVDARLYGVGSDSVSAENTSIEALIAPYKVHLDEEMDEQIGELIVELPKGRPESPLGNWLGDAVQKKAVDLYRMKVDFSGLNYGGVRVPALPKGALTRRYIFELMPFDNTLVLIHLDAAKLRQLINHMAADGGWPVSKELNYRIENGEAKDITIGGEAIQENRTYLVATIDYIANGGSDAGFLVNAKREDLGILLRDVLIERAKELSAAGEKIFAETDGRVKNDNN